MDNKNNKNNKNNWNIKGFLNAFMWATVFLIAFNVIFSTSSSDKIDNYAYSSFIQDVTSGLIQTVELQGSSITATTMDGEERNTVNPGDLGMIGDLLDSKVEIITKKPAEEGFISSIIRSLIPFLLLIGVLLYVSNKQSGGKGGIFGVGKSKAKMLDPSTIEVTLDDVAGANEAKEEISEIVDFLQNPDKYIEIGSKIPRGVLLTGPPGTGKTLIAKGVAGTAKVPFYYTSGSDFVEMFVGVGASRVRGMFEEARKNAPCIIFIDEIDAIGGQRGGSQGGGGNEEREQTLNQMLVEMDGFEGSEGVIVIAATNRPEVLDRALLRPGRFDRQIVVGLPDIDGRSKILAVHSKKVKLTDDVNMLDIARGTPGFSGADLSNLINEASILTARNDRKKVSQDDLEKAKDKVMMGAERKSMKMDIKEKETTAYHEAGHAIVGLMIGNHDPVYKISVMPRGRALGITMFLPENDKYSVSFDELSASIASLYGGRIAEEMIYGKGGISTGASNDIERASKIARDMVVKWGFSENLMPINYQPKRTGLGISESIISSETSKAIDSEVMSIIQTNYDRAKDILDRNRKLLEEMTKSLMEYETIDKPKIDELMTEFGKVNTE